MIYLVMEDSRAPLFTEDLYNSPYLENNIKTEFESLFLSQGLKINYLKAIRL